MTAEESIAALVRQREAVSPERLAAHLGLTELRVGARRSGDRRTDDRVQVLAWWAVTVEPSFHPCFAIGAVHEEDWEGGPGPGRVTVRGFAVGETGANVAALDADPVPDTLGRLNPFRVEPPYRVQWSRGDGASWGEVATLDGLGYAIRWGTKTVRDGGFQFSNPHAGWPLDFERLLYRFARRVTIAAGVGELEDALECWRGYREGIDAAEPGGTPDTGRDIGYDGA